LSRFATVLIGFGKIADTMRHDARMARFFPEASHAQVLSRHERFDLAAVVDPSEEARKRAQRDWDVKAVAADLAALPQRERYTAAVIATPPAGRLAAIEALPALRAVLIEKPLAADPDEGPALVQLCQARGIAVQVNYWRRAVPAFGALAAGGLAEAVGEVEAVFGLYGNGLMNNGSHLVDFLRMLCGEIEVVAAGKPAEAAASSVAGDRDAACLLRLANGAQAALTPVDFNAWREVGLDIWGTRGRLSIMQESLAITHYPRRENRGLDSAWEIDSGCGETNAIDASTSLRAMYDDLAAAAAAGGEPRLSPAREALATEAVVHDILQRTRA
jgi:predicted dehydrogenase